VEPGLLTPHGKTLMTQFGAYYRLKFSTDGFIVANGCADARHIYIYADTDERTIETGRGLAEGMFPGCGVAVHSQGAGTEDVLFHTAGKVGTPDTALAYSAVAGRIGSDPGGLLPAYEQQLHQLQQILFACGEADCSTPGKKQLLAIAPSLEQGTGDHLADLKGPLSTGATFAENLQLEYLEGMSAAQVGWGRVDEATMRSLMAIHAASSDIIQRAPYIAQVQASNLLVHILKTLDQAEQQKAVDGALGDPGARIVFLVGHDTNLSNVAALLDAHWLVNGYQRDDAAPGGALVFELWRRSGYNDQVHVYYTVQTPAQMRDAIPLTLDQPPARSVIFLPKCSQPGDQAPCDLNSLQHLVENASNPAFVK
jgi:4-phytase/acid phosphatase